jgi:hypothetical protein
MGRDWRVDTLRGYFLVAMTLGHFPNPLAPFTEYTLGYASAPDGFVFLSGLVSTWVYLTVWERRGTRAMISKVYRRVGTIYVAHMALVVAGILFAISSHSDAHRLAHALKTFFSAALLSNQHGFDRILPMYCLFLAFTPIVLKQFKEGRAWLIGLISATLWVGAQFGLGDATAIRATLTQGSFNFFAWQAFFVAGQYFGYRGMRSPQGSAVRSRVLLAASAVLALLLMADRHLALWGASPLLGFNGHPDHNPARFLDTACLGYLLWSIPRTVDEAAVFPIP